MTYEIPQFHHAFPDQHGFSSPHLEQADARIADTSVDTFILTTSENPMLGNSYRLKIETSSGSGWGMTVRASDLVGLITLSRVDDFRDLKGKLVTAYYTGRGLVGISIKN